MATRKKKKKNTSKSPERRMAVLQHSITFPIGVWGVGRRAGGTVLSCGTVSEAEQRRVCEAFVRDGLMSREETDAGEPGHRLVQYTITDAGRAAAREHRGLGALTVDAARLLHSTDLVGLWGGDPVAGAQLDLRTTGSAHVRGVLAGLGYRYSGTNGWHITAFATPDLLIGFVNTAKGVAVLTDRRLDAAAVEALTYPAQPEGPITSGAVAWAPVDVGESRNASAPPGWMQLILDLRTFGAEPEAVPCEAHVVMWGLTTCYKTLGEPGIVQLDPPGDAERAPFDEWPMTESIRRATRAIAERWLDSTTRVLAGLADAPAVIEALDTPRKGTPLFASAGPVAPTLPECDMGRAVDAARLGAEASRSGGYGARSALESATCATTTEIVRHAMSAAGISRIAAWAGEYGRDRVVGMRYVDAIKYLIERIVRMRLEGAADALGEQLRPFVLPTQLGEQGHMGEWRWHTTLVPILRDLAKSMLPHILAGIERSAYETRAECVSAFYADGPVAVFFRQPG